MSWNKKFRFGKQGAVLLALGSLFFIGYAPESKAAPVDPSWTKEPSWKSQGRSVQKNRKHRSRSSKRKVNSPFAPDSSNISIELGQVFLMGDLADGYQDSIGFQGHYTYGVSDIFGFDASVGYSSHNDGDLTMVSFLAGLRANLSWYDRVVPYAVFGLGFYKPSMQITPTSSVSPFLFGIHVGPGVDLLVTERVFFGASIVFHDIFGKRLVTSTKTVDVGGTYTSFLLHAGMSI